ncbi:glycoside hydrolase domain-containing protein [Bacillus sp. 1P10SD]|uniref:glycoside hydrolase domain-containing protein n=1 Tax=Bacillus sp. 1P10SD TaxID=3132265 RepID=UPI0039A4DFAE
MFFGIFSVFALAFLILIPLYIEHHSKYTATQPSQHQLQQKPPNQPPKNEQSQKPQPPQKEEPQKPAENKPDQSKIYWGVDTASEINQAFYQCVEQNYGKPDVVGRYIGDNQGASTGLTKEEVAFLKQQGIKIIPIYNHFSNATGYQNGVAEAEAAIALAKELGIPKDVVIFADIEPKYPVDAEFIRGWVETLSSSPYKPGIYGVFLDGKELSKAYNDAVAKNQAFNNMIFIWTSNPEVGTTAKDQAPNYNPNTPNTIPASIWQYGLEGKQCNIDTNLIQATAYSAAW